MSRRAAIHNSSTRGRTPVFFFTNFRRSLPGVPSLPSNSSPSIRLLSASADIAPADAAETTRCRWRGCIASPATYNLGTLVEPSASAFTTPSVVSWLYDLLVGGVPLLCPAALIRGRSLLRAIPPPDPGLLSSILRRIRRADTVPNLPYPFVRPLLPGCFWAS